MTIRYTRILVGVGLIHAMGACKNYKSFDGNAIYSSAASLKFDCEPGNFEAKKESFITWRATKINSQGQDILMVGKNSVVGTLKLGDTWKNAAANLNFVSTSTDSEDPLRDSRINSFVFGVPDSIPFGFRLTQIEGSDLTVKQNEHSSVHALGTLFIANQEAKIDIPVLVKHYQGLVSVTPSEVFKLNVRSLSPVVNGINLVNQITQLLTFVPGIKMKDEVIIDFDLQFMPICK